MDPMQRVSPKLGRSAGSEFLKVECKSQGGVSTGVCFDSMLRNKRQEAWLAQVIQTQTHGSTH